MQLRFFVWGVVFSLVACTEVALKSGEHYKVSERVYLYKLKKWSFDGRLSVTDGKESWSASIDWSHTEYKDQIKLSGPLGQGAVMIILTDAGVMIDKGDDKILQSKQVDEFVAQQLGVFVPVRALRFWVLGLPQTSYAVVEKNDGFEQANWHVHYLQMQQMEKDWFPRKVNVENHNIKLKLVIDQWAR